jgi:hypothetical protein
MENMEEKEFALIFSLFNLPLFHIVHILSLFDLPFFDIFHIVKNMENMDERQVE